MIYHGPHTRTSRHFTNNVAERDESRPYDAIVQTQRSFFGQQMAAVSISLTLPSKGYAIGGQSLCNWRGKSMLLQLIEIQRETDVQQPKNEGGLRYSKCHGSFILGQYCLTTNETLSLRHEKK